MMQDLSGRNEKDSFYTELRKNTDHIQEQFGNSDDLQVRAISVSKNPSISCALVYIDGLVNGQSINELAESLVVRMKDDILDGNSNVWKELAQTGGSVTIISDFQSLNKAIMSGQTVLLVNQHSVGYAISTEGWAMRGIQESGTESVIRGPRESFTENLRTNTALIRRRVKDPNLRIKSTALGRVTQTGVSLVYIEGIVNNKALAEIEERLKKIDIDAVLESGYVEQLIEDKKWPLFPTIFSTERPDVTAAGIIEGRIAIIVDGTPFVMLAPALFVQFFQAAEDYYLPPIYSIITRFLRYFSFLVFLLATSVYIGSTTYHQELLPTQLLISFATQRENVPFPVFVEALLLMFTYEILREAIIRMPKAIGSAVSIVGALVLGDAAIQAGFVSNSLVIVVATEAVASFILPTAISTPVRLLRFGMVVMAACFGMVGIYVACMLLITHLCSLRSFGVPYMSPWTPFNLSDQKDTFFRFPLSLMRTRPSQIGLQNRVRQRKGG